LHVGMGVCQYSPVELDMYCDIPFPNVPHPSYYSDTAQAINHPFLELLIFKCIIVIVFIVIIVCFE